MGLFFCAVFQMRRTIIRSNWAECSVFVIFTYFLLMKKVTGSGKKVVGCVTLFQKSGFFTYFWLVNRAKIGHFTVKFTPSKRWLT